MPVSSNTERVFYLYAIASIRRNYIYVGISENVIVRFWRHNNGLERTTAAYKPYILIYTEECAGREAARKREIYFKNASGKTKLREIRRELFSLMGVAGLPA